jgi:hypothetical protein
MSKETNVIGIKQLKMMIKTGIPGKEEYIDFTSALLPVKSKGKTFAKFPFFSDTHAYPKIKLQNFTYERIVEFFFNKEVFLKIIRNKTQKNVPKISQQKIKMENFEFTLRLLFPTTFPLVNNIDNSVDYIIPNKKIFTLKGSNVFSVLPRRFDRKYSYLTIDSETYTITKTVWNNDVMNHPIYSELIQTYKEFDIWKSDPSLNIFQNTSSNSDNIDIILGYVFDTIQKSEEEPLFKKMYEDSSKAPYSNSETKRLDEKTLAIQDFDNTIDELMRKDKDTLQKDVEDYEAKYTGLITDLSNNNIPNPDILKKIKQKHDSSSKVNFTKFKEEILTEIDRIQPTPATPATYDKSVVIDKVNEIILVLEQLQKSKQDIANLKKKSSSSSSDNYYIYLQKQEPEEKEGVRENFLKENPKYKLKLINLLGKLTNMKKDNYHNVSPDLLNLIDYLKINILDFNIKRRIQTFIKDLNIRFLSDPDYKTELEKIKNVYVEFYNLALVISGFKGRKIDNQIWRDAILKMMNGTLEENYFNNKIWEPLQDCYHLNDDADDTNSNKKKSGKKCDPEVISVGLDIIPKDSKDSKEENSTKTKANIQTIEIYLQMDIIEGKIDDTNVSKIKCAYDDQFLGSMFRDLINVGKQVNTFPTEQIFFSAKQLLKELESESSVKTKGGYRKTKTKTKKFSRISNSKTKKKE